MLILLILSILFNAVLVFLLVRTLGMNQDLLNSNKEYEHYFNKLQNQLSFVIDTMRGIDSMGAFEADDEVGIAFKGLLQCVSLLKPFVYDEEIDEEKEIQ